MAHAILLVDSQKDILRLLHSALDALGNPDLEIREAASSQAALEAINEQPIDLLVTDSDLPGSSGLELMQSARAALPDLRVILITGSRDRKVRDQLLGAGAAAVFNKPVPLGDFLAAVDRGLGAADAPVAEEAAEAAADGPMPLSEVLANFRQQHNLDALLLISNRGRILERTGDLRDQSMQVSLISAVTAAFAAGLKVAESNRQESLSQFAVFTGGDQDLILIPVDPMHALLAAGRDVTTTPALDKIVSAIDGLKDEVRRSLPEANRPARQGASVKPTREIDAVLDAAAGTGVTQEELDEYWDRAATQHANQPMSDDVIPYDKARKMGLTPDSEE